MISWIDFANSSKALGPTTDKEAYQTANPCLSIESTKQDEWDYD